MQRTKLHRRNFDLQSEQVIPDAAIVCKNCGNSFSGKYCNQCGEKVYREHDKSVLHILEEGFHFITHFEGTFFRSIRAVLSRPGELALKYSEGIRKPYFRPVSLFFFLVLLYLIFPVFEGLNMRVYYHMNHSFYGAYATAESNSFMEAHQLTFESFTKLFREKSERVSKFLLFIIIPLSALFFWACTFRKRRYFFDQMVFSAEVNSFYLLWGFLIFPLILSLVQFFSEWFTGGYLRVGDMQTGLISSGVMMLFFYFASRRYYGLRWWRAVLFGLLFLVAHFIIVQVIYKFALFNLVMWQLR